MSWLSAKGGCGDPSCDDCAQEWGRKKASMTNTETIIGRTVFHSETGPEGGHWAVQNNEGLYILRDGDRLTIYRSDGETPLWEGIIELIYHPLFSESAHGHWIHADQAGEPRAIWSQYFFLELSCKLVREVAE